MMVRFISIGHLCRDGVRIVFVLTLGRRYVISIVVDVFFLQTTPLGSKEILSEMILLWKRNLRGVESVRGLLRNRIT
jgi:hypothetical protein